MAGVEFGLAADGEQRFLFSVIMPIYNTEGYLEEAIESIVNQSIGFEKSIQLILVNDGSTDGSEAICLKYASEYPNNIVYKYQENGGVAAASNAGLALAEGYIVNFFGSDDRWATDAFQHAGDFFAQHYEEIDMLACRLAFFGAQEGFGHPLDYRFDDGKDKIVDLETDFTMIQMMSGPCFFKADVLKKRQFDNNLRLSEDALLISDILLDKLKYGLVAHAVYHYRKRGDGTQLTELALLDRSRYTVSPKAFALKMFAACKERCGEVKRFVQYTAAYEIQWILKVPLPDDMSEAEKEVFKADVSELFSYIEIPVIRALKGLGFSHKVLLLKVKYGEAFDGLLSLTKQRLHIDGHFLTNVTKNRRLINLKILEIEGDEVILEGTTNIRMLDDKARIVVRTSDGLAEECELVRCEPYCSQSYLGPISGTGDRFYFRVNLKNIKWFRFELVCSFGVLKTPFNTQIFSKLCYKYDYSYYAKGAYILILDEAKIKVRERTEEREKRCEKKMRDAIYEKGKELDELADARKAISIRRRALRMRKRKTKPIWILSDRFNKAGDNAENLFRYLSSINAQEKYDIYFLFEHQYPDYKRLKRYGKVLDPHSRKYAPLFLCADKIISAHADASVMNPFGGKGYALSNLFDFDYVYITHGVMPGNLSSWLNRLNKNTKLITASAQREMDQLLGPEYAYDESQVALTGMARHDALGVLPRERKIVFLPTWRSKLAGEVNSFERRRARVEDFSQTEYCRFYNRLINDEALIAAMRKHGYTGEFYVHPSFEKQAADFHGNDVITVGSGLANYESILNRASLMVTDYSSVAFDFGVQRKMVVYTQFDHEVYWKMHFYDKGYFDYERDGFGPVCYDYETAVKTLVDAVSNDCAMPEQYAARCDAFFAFHDHENSRRVYEAICNLDKKRSNSGR